MCRIALQPGGGAPAFPLAAQLDELHEAQGALRRVEPAVGARAAEVVDVGAQLGVGQQAGLHDVRLLNPHAERDRRQLRIAEQRGRQRIAHGDGAARRHESWWVVGSRGLHGKPQHTERECQTSLHDRSSLR
jgi:hypothetical protein